MSCKLLLLFKIKSLTFTATLYSTGNLTRFFESSTILPFSAERKIYQEKVWEEIEKMEVL